MRHATLALAFAGAIGLSGPTWAQQPVVTSPTPQLAGQGANVSGTVAATNVFQQLWIGTQVRVGCTIQNNGVATMWVFFGPLAQADKAKAVILAPNQALQCSNGVAVASDQISITGTMGDPFFASQGAIAIVSAPPAAASGGTSSNFGAAFPPAGTAIGVKNGANMVNLTADGSSNLNVNCAAGCAGGTFNNNSDGVATSATNGQSAAWLYAFNGTTWDRLRADGAKNLNVNVNAALPAGTAVIGHVVVDSGSTTVVTGNVTVVQPTGTNLHVVTDATSVTAATLSAETTKVIGTVRVLGNGGATVDSTVGAGTAPANAMVAGALFNSTEISPTTGQAFALQADSKGRLRNVLMDAAGNTRGANVNASSQLSVSVDNNPVLGAGSAVIGHVIADSGSTTAVTGNVTVQQATAANLNANVSQATGTNLHVVTDATSTTAVTQATAANLNAAVVGTLTPADGLALGTTSVSEIARNTTYNGTTSDLWRGAANGLNSTGTGLGVSQGVAQCDDTSPTAITENNFGNIRMDCATHAQVVTITPSATVGGTTLFTLTLAASTNATNVKASAGQVYSISGFNLSSATPVFISLYNNAGTPTCGTAIIQQFMIPGSTTGTGFVYDFAAPKGFATGIAFCATTGIAGTGNPAATTYVLNIDYK